MFDFLLRLTHKRPCESKQKAEQQKIELPTPKNTQQIPEKIIAEIDAEKLTEAIVRANQNIEKQKEEKQKNNDLDIYTTLHHCTQAFLFLINFLALLSGMALFYIFMDWGETPSEFANNIAVLFFSVVCFAIAFVTRRLITKIKTITNKEDIKDLFNSTFTFAAVLFAIIGDQIKEAINICLNTLLNDNQLVVIIVIYVAIVFIEYVYNNIKEHLCNKRRNETDDKNEK